MATTSASAAESVHPLAHAVGGSLGSALALLLLYPLERARIELQSSAAGQPHRPRHTLPPSSSRQPPDATSGSSTDQTKNEKAESEINSDEEIIQVQPPPPDESWTIAGCDDISLDPAQSQSDSRSIEGSESDALQSQEGEKKQLDLLSCFRRIWEKDELYLGVGPIVLTLATSNFVFFFLNETIKRVLLPSASNGSRPSQSPKSRSTPYLSLLASCLAGICNVLITNPLWVTNLKIVTGSAESSSLLTEIQNVARKDGLPELWKGTGTSVLLVSNPVLQFFVYEQLKSARLSRHRQSGAGKSLAPGEAFLMGALSKGVATILTYPLQLAQAVLRLQQRSNNSDSDHSSSDSSRATGDQQQQQRYRGTWDCLLKLYQRDGAKGLFTGMKAKLLQTVLTAAFTFLTYEQILHAVHAAHKSLLAKRKLR
jgi:adenine nucleotide transporter 17